MRTYNLFLKLALLVALLLNSINIARSCIDYDPEGNRFWLFSPNVSNMQHLLPYTLYSYETYYPGRFQADYDTAHYAVNIAAWKNYLGGKVSEKDIANLLYNTPPKLYKAKKYDQKNGFVAAMNKDAELKQYIDLAKRYEEAYQKTDNWTPYTERTIPPQVALINACRHYLETVKQPELKERCAYLLMKTLRNNGEVAEMQNVYEQYLKKSKKNSWYVGSACYFYGESLKDSVQKAQYYVEAWRLQAETQKQIQRFFHHQRMLPFIQQIPKAEDRATMYALAGLSYPAHGMGYLLNVWKNDPNNAELPMLAAREVNKLEDWLLSPELTKTPFRIEYGIFHEGEIPKAPVLHKNDMEHLHALRQWVGEVLFSGKRNNEQAFWQLTAAQLAFLDQDFQQAKLNADAAAKQPNTPAQQLVQAQLLSFLTDIASAQTITPAMEEHIPALWEIVENNRKSIENATGLQNQLALLLADMLMKKGSIAKGCLLLSRTGDGNYFPLNTPQNSPYDMLLAAGNAADYDQAIEILERPSGVFQKWLADKPATYRFNWEEREIYNEKTQRYEMNPNYKPTWNVLKIRELKAIYFTRQDQLDSALVELRKIQPIDYDFKDNAELKYYFQHNPFSVGIELPYLPLSNMNLSQPFNKVTFLEKLLEIKEAAKGKQKEELQKDLFLIANAYYNMSWPGKGWWLMNTPYKGSGDMVDEYVQSARDMRTGATDMPAQNKLPNGLCVILSLGFLGFLGYKKRYIVLFSFALLGGVVGFVACKNKQESDKVVIKTPETPLYLKNYATSALARAWYEKSKAAAPGTEIAVIAQMMISKCDEHAQELQERINRKEDYIDQEAENAKPKQPKQHVVPPNVNYSPSALSCQAFSDYIGNK